MNEFEIRKIIQEELKKCGIKVPVEETFDYSGVEEPENASNL